MLKSVATYKFCAAHKDSNETYLDKKTYCSDGKRPDCIPALIGEMSRILDWTGKPKRNEPHLDHYINKHDNVPLWVIMNNLYLGQAFRFYDYLTESIRLPIERRLQALYVETHFEVKRITHKDLKNALATSKTSETNAPTTKDSTVPKLTNLVAQNQRCHRRPRTCLSSQTIQLLNKGNHEHHYRNIIRNPRNRAQGHTRADGLFIPGRNLPFRKPTPLQLRMPSQTIKTTSNNNAHKHNPAHITKIDSEHIPLPRWPLYAAILLKLQFELKRTYQESQ